jgi:alcohol dehydrogenase (cytochrome c)
MTTSQLVLKPGNRMRALSICLVTGLLGTCLAPARAPRAATISLNLSMRQATHATVADWPHFGNSTDQTRFSGLTQISTTNISRLGIAWTFQQDPRLAEWETDPLVVNGIMYLTTNTSQVIALNAASGKQLWRYTPTVSFMQLLRGGSAIPVNRGVEQANGHIYLLTYDARLVALDARTGKPIWIVPVAGAASAYTEPSPPTYWNGMLFVGSAEGDSGLRGFVAAFRASDGRPLWRYYTVPAPGHGWVPRAGAHGGGDVWMPPTVDSRSGMLYFGTGNPSPDLAASDRPGCNRWTDALVALNARSGTFKWGRTQVCPDVWDYDSGQTPMLVNLMLHGKNVRAVGLGNKSGYYWIYDARTGASIARSPALAKQSAPRPIPTTLGVTICPGKFGGLGYSPPAYSPTLGSIFVTGADMCMFYKRAPDADIHAHAPGTPDIGGSADQVKGAATGFMAAIDARTGRIRWRVAVPKPMFGGVLSTAGGLVLSGGDDGRLYAFDARTGRVIWRANLGLGFGAAPITYAVNGTQYIAIATGGSSAAPLTGARVGGTLVVFKLDGRPIRRLPSAG